MSTTTHASPAPGGHLDTAPTGDALLHVSGLVVQYRTRRRVVDAVRGVDLSLAAGRTLALVGESGSGKSTTAHAVTALLPGAARVTAGSILLAGQDLLRMGEKELRRLRGAHIGVVPQDPTVSLNPVMRIGDQVGEVLRIHDLADGDDAHERVVAALAHAGIDRPGLRAEQYPHELSGGMRQRVLIAAALIARPALLVADEPTSALDVTVQRQILDHIEVLTRETGTAVLLVTHDLGVAADRADHVAVMSQGRIVETGTPDEVLGAAQHPYTRSLIAAAPSLRSRVGVAVGWEPTAAAASAPSPAPTDIVLRATGLDKYFAVPASPAAPDGVLHAVADVSLEVPRGRTLAIVGESGSGKSTTARLLLRLAPVTRGRIELDGQDITSLGGAQLRQLRRRLQIVQQNPYATLNPRMSVGQVIADPLHSLRLGTRRERRRRVADLLDLVGLPASYVDRQPAELSGGQRQRVAIARALSVRPDVVILDEPVSALDVRVQSQVLDLLARLQRELEVSYVFISHDLAVVRQVAHTIGVMRRGRLLEVGDAEQVLATPRHEYTAELLDAVPGRIITER